MSSLARRVVRARARLVAPLPRRRRPPTMLARTECLLLRAIGRAGELYLDGAISRTAFASTVRTWRAWAETRTIAIGRD